jgi:hypothetical protein
MTKRARNILLVAAILVMLTFCGLYFINIFFRAFAPDDITITQTEIQSPRGFVNPITIEKLKVDSIGEEQRPVKYTVEYVTTCGIKQKEGKPPVALKKIKLSEPGRYSWSEENVNIPIVHDDGYSKRIDSVQRIIWSNGHERFDICPLKFEKGNWYFINFLNPQIIGIYVYIDKDGNLKQYTTYSGVSPI